MTSSDKCRNVAILAATFSGNKGASSMLETIVDHLSQADKEISFDILSVYPKEDRKQNPYTHCTIVSATPKAMVFWAFPLALLIFTFGRLPFVRSFLSRFSPILASLSRSDLVVDATGVSFVDQRGWLLNLYNAICLFVPLAMKKKVVKFAQAMGPFEKPMNRLMAKALLPKVHTICARGLITQRHLSDLGLSNVTLCADGALVLPEHHLIQEKIGLEIEKDSFFKHPLIGISLSSVVFKYCQKIGVDYIFIMSEFIDYLCEKKGYHVLLLAQSARENKEALKNNDLPICRPVFNGLSKESKMMCKNLDRELSAREIREYIARCDMLVASRFHAMISALHKKVPVFLIGWSHKYKEVLDMFQLGQYAINYKTMGISELIEQFEAFEKNTPAIRAKIEEHLPHVQKSSFQNINVIMGALQEKIQ